MYFIKNPFWLKRFYSSLTWDINTKEKILYLTFDDGPHPTATPFVLEQLKQYDAKATFFCIGNNVVKEPSLYRRVIDEGHAIGNHTYDHLNGWKTDDTIYINNIIKAQQHIDSKLFRPPYGRITKFQSRLVQQKLDFKIIMWSVLSADFDTDILSEKCAANVTKNAKSGSIIVFHDSEKAFKNISYALPKVLEHFTKQQYKFNSLESL